MACDVTNEGISVHLVVQPLSVLEDIAQAHGSPGPAQTAARGVQNQVVILGVSLLFLGHEGWRFGVTGSREWITSSSCLGDWWRCNTRAVSEVSVHSEYADVLACAHVLRVMRYRIRDATNPQVSHRTVHPPLNEGPAPTAGPGALQTSQARGTRGTRTSLLMPPRQRRGVPAGHERLSHAVDAGERADHAGALAQAVERLVRVGGGGDDREPPGATARGAGPVAPPLLGERAHHLEGLLRGPPNRLVPVPPRAPDGGQQR